MTRIDNLSICKYPRIICQFFCTKCFQCLVKIDFWPEMKVDMLRFTFSIVLVLATDLSIKPVGWQLSFKNGTTINGVGIKPELLWLKYQIVRLKYRIVRLKYQIVQDVKKGSNDTTSGYMSSERKSGQFVRIIAMYFHLCPLMSAQLWLEWWFKPQIVGWWMMESINCSTTLLYSAPHFI